MRGRKLVSAASIAALFALSAALAAASAPAALAAHWEVRQPLTPTPPTYKAEEYFAGASCPAQNRCVVIGEPNLVASSSDPLGGAGAWPIVQPAEAVPCEDNPHRCDPPPELPPGFPQPLNLAPWQQRTNTDVSCAGPGFCAATTLDGFVYVSSNPLGDASAWSVFDVDGAGEGPNIHLEGISCPEPGFCVAVAGNPHTTGAILSTDNPAGGPSAWHRVDLGDSFDLKGVACGSRAFCIAVGQHGRVVRSTNPLGPASSWDDLGTPGGPGNLAGIDCVDTALCVAGNSGGNLLSTEDPLAAEPEWREVSGGGSVLVTDVSCPDVAHCLAVDDNGDVLTSTDPTGGPGSWSKDNLIPYVERDPKEFPVAPNGIFAVSCASTSLCVLGATEHRIYTSADPFAAPPPRRPGKKKRRRSIRPRTYLAHVDRVHTYTKNRVTRMSFRFYARGKVRGFRCQHDGGRWRGCESPHRYWVDLGRHAFRVRAIGPTGLEGPVARDRFRVVDNNVCHPPHCQHR